MGKCNDLTPVPFKGLTSRHRQHRGQLTASPVVHLLVFCVRQNVRLQVGWLRKLLCAAVKRTDVWPITCVNAYVSAQVEVKWKPFAAAFERTLHTDQQHNHISTLTPSLPAVPNCCCSKASATHCSNTPFWHSGALALGTECQGAWMSKIKNSGLDQYGAEPFKQQQFGTAGIKGVNTAMEKWSKASDKAIIVKSQSTKVLYHVLQHHVWLLLMQ